MRVRGALLLLFFSLIIIGPAHAQPEVTLTPTPIAVQIEGASGTTIVVPEGSPWWAGIAITSIGAVIYLTRRYVDHRLNQKEKEKSAEVAVVERDQTIDLTQAQVQLKLVDNIGKVADAIQKSNIEWAEDRRQAARERGEFMEVLKDNTSELKTNTEGVIALSKRIDDSNESNKNEHKATRDKVDEINGKVDEVIRLIKDRFPKSSDDPTETKDVTADIATNVLEDVKIKVSQLAEGE